MAKVHLNLDMNKVMVAYDNYDLFERGFYSIEHNRHETLDRVVIPRSVFTSSRKGVSPNWIDSEKWGYGLNCGYSGTGPSYLRDFILSNSSYKDADNLYKKIASNNVVIFNFNTNELETYNSTFSYEHYSFNIMVKDNGKFVLLSKVLQPHTSKRNKKEAIEYIHNSIQLASRIFDTNLRYIKYIGDNNSDEFSYYSVGTSVGSLQSNFYNFILEFDEFEIWMDYPFSLEQKNIQFDDEFKELLNALNYPLLNKKYDNKLFQIVDRLMNNDQQSNQVIPVFY